MTIDEIANEEYEHVGDEKLFPNHTDKQVWMSGFRDGYLYYMKKNNISLIKKHDEDTMLCSLPGHMKTSSSTYNEIISKGENTGFVSFNVNELKRAWLDWGIKEGLIK